MFWYALTWTLQYWKLELQNIKGIQVKSKGSDENCT